MRIIYRKTAPKVGGLPTPIDLGRDVFVVIFGDGDTAIRVQATKDGLVLSSSNPLLLRPQGTNRVLIKAEEGL